MSPDDASARFDGSELETLLAWGVGFEGSRTGLGGPDVDFAGRGLTRTG
jgi:hypothetical protein